MSHRATNLLQNTKDINIISSANCTPLLLGHNIKCQRCRKNVINAQKEMEIDQVIPKNDSVSICNHCRKKAESNRVYDKILKLISSNILNGTKSENISNATKLWSNLQRILEKHVNEECKHVKKLRSLSEQRIRDYLYKTGQSSPIGKAEDAKVNEHSYSATGIHRRVLSESNIFNKKLQHDIDIKAKKEQLYKSKEKIGLTLRKKINAGKPINPRLKTDESIDDLNIEAHKDGVLKNENQKKSRTQYSTVLDDKETEYADETLVQKTTKKLSDPFQSTVISISHKVKDGKRENLGPGSKYKGKYKRGEYTDKINIDKHFPKYENNDVIAKSEEDKTIKHFGDIGMDVDKKIKKGKGVIREAYDVILQEKAKKIRETEGINNYKITSNNGNGETTYKSHKGEKSELKRNVDTKKYIESKAGEKLDGNAIRDNKKVINKFKELNEVVEKEGKEFMKSKGNNNGEPSLRSTKQNKVLEKEGNKLTSLFPSFSSTFETTFEKLKKQDEIRETAKMVENLKHNKLEKHPILSDKTEKQDKFPKKGGKVDKIKDNEFNKQIITVEKKENGDNLLEKNNIKNDKVEKKYLDQQHTFSDNESRIDKLKDKKKYKQSNTIEKPRNLDFLEKEETREHDSQREKNQIISDKTEKQDKFPKNGGKADKLIAKKFNKQLSKTEKQENQDKIHGNNDNLIDHKLEKNKPGQQRKFLVNDGKIDKVKDNNIDKQANTAEISLNIKDKLKENQREKKESHRIISDKTGEQNKLPKKSERSDKLKNYSDKHLNTAEKEDKFLEKKNTLKDNKIERNNPGQQGKFADNDGKINKLKNSKFDKQPNKYNFGGKNEYNRKDSQYEKNPIISKIPSGEKVDNLLEKESIISNKSKTQDEIFEKDGKVNKLNKPENQFNTVKNRLSNETIGKQKLKGDFKQALDTALTERIETERDSRRDVINLEKHMKETNGPQPVDEIVLGNKIYNTTDIPLNTETNEVVTLLYHKSTFDKKSLVQNIQEDIRVEEVQRPKFIDPNAAGVIRYALSDRSFIDNGWTQLPTEKVVRKMTIYRMRLANPELNWFERYKNKEPMTYDAGEKFVEFEENGRGRWYYRNGKLALNYYDAEDVNAQQRVVIFSNGEPDERGRSRPVTVLATFDYSGNGVVFDHTGKIRLKYNQSEGVVLDRNLGPVSHWQWHSLNDPPVLQKVMIDTHLLQQDPRILKLGKNLSDPSDYEKINKGDNDALLAIEFDNFIKEKSQKLSQKFHPFQIKMKALKINEQFSLKVLDQANIYLIFRDGKTSLKWNLGMILDNHEIIDTETAEMGDVTTGVEKWPPQSASVDALQKSIAHAQHVERHRLERDRKWKPTNCCESADRLVAGLSRPLRWPLMTHGQSRFPNTSNLYYNTRF